MASDSEKTPDAYWRGFILTLLIALPVAILGFLWSGEFFDAYEGTAVAYRPLPGSDGQDDVIKRFVLEQEGGKWTEVVLPTEAFSGLELPQSPYGAPPLAQPEDAVRVQKSRFTLHVWIGEGPWATASALDLLLPSLFLVVVALGRNLVVTGSAFQVSPEGEPHLPLPLQPPSGQVAPSEPASRPKISKKGPPPRHRGHKR